ncbi:MAG: hypothetical protein ACM3PT_12040 [Deltaproteobacteria bacterium]
MKLKIVLTICSQHKSDLRTPISPISVGIIFWMLTEVPVLTKVSVSAPNYWNII